MDRVKIYSYSNKLLAFVDAKRAIAKLAVGGIIIGSLLFFGFIKLNQALGITPGSRAAIALEAENNVLRQELILISPRVSKLAAKVKELCAQDDNLHLLLSRQKYCRRFSCGSYVSGQTVEASITEFCGGKFTPLISTEGCKRPDKD